MVQLILIRPGCTDYDQQSRIQGTLDIPLSEAGRKEATEAVACLRSFQISALYCAPCSSAEQSAALIAEALKLKAKTIDRLQNVNLGLWQGMLIDEVRRKQPKVYKQWQEHPESVQPPEGEMLANALQRAEETLEKLARKHRSGTIGLIAPEPIASIIRHRLEGGERGDLWRASNGCSRIDVLRLESILVPAGEAPAEASSSAPATNGSSNGAPTTGAAGLVHKPKSRVVFVYRGTVVEGR